MRHADEIRALVEQTATAFGPIESWSTTPVRWSRRLTLLEITDAHLDEVYALNVKSAVLAAKAVAPAMIERRKARSSMSCRLPGTTAAGRAPALTPSCKAALTCYTKSMAKELAPHGVRVNAVAPGVIDTPFHEEFSTPEMLKNFVAAIPLGRLGTPQECATVIAFLASSAASLHLGETIEVNGGQLMR